LFIRCTGAATPSAANHCAVVVPDRRGDGAQPAFALLVVDRVAAQPRFVQHGEDRLPLGDGLRRVRGQPAAYCFLHVIARLMGEQHLADGGAVQRGAPADGRRHADRAPALHLIDIEHAEVIDDAELERFRRFFSAARAAWGALVGNVHAAAHQAPSSNSATRGGTCPSRVLLQESGAGQRRRETVHRALGEPQPVGEGRDAELVLFAGKGREQADGVR